MKIVFVHAGRLTKEKGSDMVIELCRQLEGTTLADKIELHIFGKGVYADEFQELAENNAWLTMHGFQQREELFKVWDESHYTLLPSKFLETFGLSALESCSHGSVPVGFQKGGLEQFVDSYYAIDEQHTLHAIVEMLVLKFVDWQWLLESKHVQEVAAKYSAKRWLYRFEELSGLAPYSGHHITMISDYGTKEGGIESYIEDASTLLCANGYDVSLIFGTSAKLSRRQRYWGVMRALWTNKGYTSITRTISSSDTKTDLVWRHSVHRNLGHRALDATQGMRTERNTDVHERYMLHDVGLLHPRPQRVYDEDHLVRSVSFAGFLKEGGLMMLPFTVVKWLSVSTIIKKIKQRGYTVLTPSSFLEQHCVNHGLGTPGSVHTFAHTIETTYCEQDLLTKSDA